MKKIHSRGIVMIILLYVVLFVVMMVDVLYSLNIQSLYYVSHYKDRINALQMARSGANHIVHILTYDRGYSPSPLNRSNSSGNYKITFDTTSADRSVNNLLSSAMSVTTNYEGKQVSPYTADLLITGTSGKVKSKVHVVITSGIDFNRSAGATGKVVIEDNSDIDGIKSLADPNQKSDGGLFSMYKSLTGDPAISWDGAGAFNVLGDSKIETVPSQDAGADCISNNIKSLYPSKINEASARDNVPLYDVDRILDIKLPSTTSMTVPATGSVAVINQEKKVEGNTTINGDINLQGGTLYINGDLTVNGGIRGTGSVFVKGDINIIGGTSSLITNQPAGAGIFSGGSIDIQGVNAAGYLDDLATTVDPSGIGPAKNNFTNEFNLLKNNATSGILSDALACGWGGMLNNTNHLTRQIPFWNGTTWVYGDGDYFVNPIPGPNGDRPDGSGDGYIPKLIRSIINSSAVNYSTNAKAQKVVQALLEVHYFLRHNANSAQPVYLGTPIQLDDQYRIVGVPDFNTYNTTWRVARWDDDSLSTENWTLNHLYDEATAPPIKLDLYIAARKMVKNYINMNNPLDSGWLTNSYFQGILYAQNNITVSDDFQVIGGVVSNGNVSIAGNSKLIYNEEYMKSSAIIGPIRLVVYEEL